MYPHDLLLAAEISRRLFVCLQLTKVSAILWHCCSTLLRGTRPISEASLAEIVGAPRTTVRSHMEYLIDMDLACRVSGGLVLSEKGSQILGKFSQETLSIVVGDKDGYSPILLELISLAMRKKRTKPARKSLAALSFKPAIRF